MIEDVRIYLAGLWVAVMLTYLLGDVLRIYAGDVTPGEINGMRVTQGMMLGIAVLMLIPIIMVFLSLALPYPIIRWLSIIVAGFWFIFNLIGLPGYTGAYDRFLLAVSMIFNILTIIYAVRWESAAA
ncbi:MAG: hypothetical protein UZ15_CFX003002535 [Chloroflexi bacterium OLB15]|nr:MAG: hypothetical protein UZ15_CFX003002535 [Chloroflexi bacterium OLB15]